MTERQKQVAIGAVIVLIILAILWWARRRLTGLKAGDTDIPGLNITLGDIIVNPPGGYTFDLITQAPAVYVINGQACGCGCDSLTLEAPNLQFMTDGLNAYLRDQAYQTMAGLYALYGIDYSRYAVNG